jgi:hypothetical protein
MSREYDPSGNFNTGNYLVYLGKFSLDNAVGLDLHDEFELDQDYLDALVAADSDSDLADLPSHKEPTIPEVTEDRSY